MPEKNEHKENQKGLTSEVRLYIEKRVELFTLTLAEQISLVAAHSIQKLIGILLLSGAAFFLWFSLGFFLGELLDSFGLGFLLAALPLLLAGFIFANQKSKKLTEKIQADLIGKVMENFDSKLNSEEEKENNE